MFAEVVQRVAVLGEDEQLAPAVLEFLELGALQARLEGGELRVRRVVADTRGPGREVLEGGDFRSELVQPDGGRELVDKLVALGVVQVVLVLLGVGQAALQLGQSRGRAGPAGGLRVPSSRSCCRSSRRRIDSWMAIVELASRRWKTVRARATLACSPAARLREELVDVGGDRLVEVVLLQRSA